MASEKDNDMQTMLEECKLRKIEDKYHPHRVLPVEEKTKEEKLIESLKPYYVNNIYWTTTFDSNFDEKRDDELPSAKIIRQFHELEKLRIKENQFELIYIYIAYIKSKIMKFIELQTEMLPENNIATILVDFSKSKMNSFILEKIVYILNHKIFTNYFGEYDIDITFDFGEANAKKYCISQCPTVHDFDSYIKLRFPVIPFKVKHILLTPKGTK